MSGIRLGLLVYRAYYPRRRAMLFGKLISTGSLPSIPFSYWCGKALLGQAFPFVIDHAELTSRKGFGQSQLRTFSDKALDSI